MANAASQAQPRVHPTAIFENAVIFQMELAIRSDYGDIWR
jgi:hypothetical protein